LFGGKVADATAALMGDEVPEGGGGAASRLSYNF
jgi:hypothetical protein